MRVFNSKCGLYTMHSEKLNIPSSIVKHELHNHNQYEFFYLRKGNVEFNIEGEIYHVNEGEVVFINYHEYHSLNVKSPDIYDRVVIQTEEIFLNSFVLDTDIFQFIRSKPIGKNNKVSCTAVKTYGLDKLFIKMEELNEEDSETTLLIKCSLIELLINLRKAYELEPKQADKKSSALLIKLLAYINDNLSHDLSLDHLASTFYLTKYYICHKFKKEMNISITEYIINKRILLANNLIHHGMTAIEACFETGFKSYPNFYRAFVKVLGRAPKGASTKQDKQ